MTDVPLRRFALGEIREIPYPIPDGIRDAQVRAALRRPVPRLQLFAGERREPIAIVGYGPSLRDTWPELRRFRFILTCSGAHRFVIDRGLRPAWHVELDPRAHKMALIGKPHRKVEYLIASVCAPALFEHLRGFRVTMWHCFPPGTETWRLLPPDEWALSGGGNAGLRGFRLARLLGFRELHVFGMDGCDGTNGRHAGAHPNQAPIEVATEYRGVEYRTTPAFLWAAERTFRELDELPDVSATFYGEGLVQAMARDYVRQPGATGALAFAKRAKLSPAYRQLNQQLHDERPDYGVAGGDHAQMVLGLVEQFGLRSVLDYGCGKGALAAALPWPIWEYDPAIPGKDEEPRPADLVVCTDVLEHVEPDYLPAVLADLQRCATGLLYVVVHTAAANKALPDGRNAHLTQEPAAWWLERLAQRFRIAKVRAIGDEHGQAVCILAAARAVDAARVARLEFEAAA
jgi:hypothetical protein